MNQVAFTILEFRPHCWHYIRSQAIRLPSTQCLTARFGLTHQNPNAVRQTLTGFTLIEVLIVMGLIFFFAALTLPVSIDFYRTSTVEDLAAELESSLRQAQAAAMTGRGNSDAGIKIGTGEYTIFEGSSYAERRPALDIKQSYPGGVEITGPDEIVFQKGTGLPILPLGNFTINLKFNSQQAEIMVNSQGLISSQ